MMARGMRQRDKTISTEDLKEAENRVIAFYKNNDFSHDLYPQERFKLTSR